MQNGCSVFPFLVLESFSFKYISFLFLDDLKISIFELFGVESVTKVGLISV
ncbi:hypothetical protein HanRHA438_Chr13g0598101 [Helianthus annuus]|uniref:Uncharacterized protein n=1 Tax=Helianthus annuus TaxID=4232 RepID=A0A9K3EGY3_HELAN|nr:hypothetical protein HanXRQr2_Chr13g0587481 [Helianthus annuus]KAJ0849161.1 hypothetical protein HanPSC8_Chr13g0565741 [Helianthus annuus]KAJ0858162.1 hypothetical protein HanRHA438_Chr13g0598101 [Helianthus annuus]